MVGLEHRQLRQTSVLIQTKQLDFGEGAQEYFKRYESHLKCDKAYLDIRRLHSQSALPSSPAVWEESPRKAASLLNMARIVEWLQLCLICWSLLLGQH